MFKFLLIVAILATCLSISNSQENYVPVVKQEVDDGGQVFNFALPDDNGANGTFTWISPEAKPVKIPYNADENIYQAEDGIPH